MVELAAILFVVIVGIPLAAMLLQFLVMFLKSPMFLAIVTLVVFLILAGGFSA